MDNIFKKFYKILAEFTRRECPLPDQAPLAQLTSALLLVAEILQDINKDQLKPH